MSNAVDIETTYDFDPTYYCEECFVERGKLVRFTFLPVTTMHEELVVKVCEYCDGKELIKLANREEQKDWSDEDAS